jgi:hypothetical protein
MRLIDEISTAVLEGFDGNGHIERIRGGRGPHVNLVYIGGYAEPIQVMSDDMILPEWARPAAAGISLDVQAILASR